MGRRLFEGLDVSSGREGRRPWVVVMSFGLHATAFVAIVLLPLLSAGDAPVIVWAAPADPCVVQAPRVTLSPKPPTVRAQTQTQPTASAAPAQSIQVPTVVPDHLPTTDVARADPGPPMTTGFGCAECAPADPGTPVGSGDPGAGTADGGGRLVVVGGDIQPPRKLKHVAPIYPPLALRVHLSGMVIVECVIDADGRVTSARVLRGHPLLDAAAVRAVEQWIYEPTRLNGIPVAVQMTVTIRFQVK